MSLQANLGEIIVPQYQHKDGVWIRQIHFGRVFAVEGVNVELFPLRVMAHAIGKTSQTIFYWEREKRFPKPLWLVPEKRHERPMRYYSKVQIANLRALFKSHGRRNVTPEFLQEAWRVFYLLDLTPDATTGDVS